jgi:hypothetical protein
VDEGPSTASRSTEQGRKERHGATAGRPPEAAASPAAPLSSDGDNGDCRGRQKQYAIRARSRLPDAGPPVAEASEAIPSAPAAARRNDESPPSNPDFNRSETTPAAQPSSTAGANGTLADAGNADPCTGCALQGVCVSSGTTNPENPCEVCDPRRSAMSWSANDGVLCDDELFCTIDEVCSAGRCVGGERQCDDGVSCNGVAVCDENSDICVPGSNQCPNNTACDIVSGQCVTTCGGCLIAGSCVAIGAEEPGNACRICDTVRSRATYSPAGNGAPCGTSGGGSAQCTNGACIPVLRASGAACTTGGQCQSGSCTGGFCCAEPCSGVCASCQQGTGACIAPADDPSCPSVNCNGGPCKISQTLTSARCRAVNECKTTADCPALSNVAARTPCGPADSHQLCINGNCTLPTVLCGGVNQQVTTTSACCEILGDAAGPRESVTTLASCPPSSLDFGGLTTTPITCDDGADCPLGEICCLRSVGESAIECTPQSTCTMPTTQYTVCSSPQGVVASCQRGTCSPFFLGGFVSGWGFCQ